MFDRLEQKRRPVKTEIKDPKLQELQEKLEAKKAGRLPLSTDQEICYMAESASGQDKANPAFWLATQAGPLRISRVGPVRENSLFGRTVNHLLTRPVWWLSTWPIYGHLDEQAWSMAHIYLLYFVWLTPCVEIIIDYLNEHLLHQLNMFN